MKEFAHEVVELVYHSAKHRILPTEGAQVPDFYDTLGDAIVEFYRKLERNPDLFPTAKDAANWIFKVVSNMNRWSNTEPTVPLPEWEVALEHQPALAYSPNANPGADQEAGLDPDIAALGAASVIQQYFASPQAHHQGRLSITAEEVSVIKAAAEYGLDDASSTITTASYQLISEVLGQSVDKIQRTLYKSRAAFAEVFYVVGALGPANAFTSAQNLADAIADFQQRFRGQNDWSILKFAARSAIPQGAFARVDPELYNQSIEKEYTAPSGSSGPVAKATPNQAERLGWQPGGSAPSNLLHQVEARAAQAFGNPHPRCVFCGCELHSTGGAQ